MFGKKNLFDALNSKYYLFHPAMSNFLESNRSSVRVSVDSAPKCDGKNRRGVIFPGLNCSRKMKNSFLKDSIFKQSIILNWVVEPFIQRLVDF